VNLRVKLCANLPIRITAATRKRAGENARQQSARDRQAPRASIAPRGDVQRHELRAATHPCHHQVTVEAREPSRAVRGAMPERLVVTIHADLIRGLDRLPAIDAKLDQSAHTDATAGNRVIAARPVASFAAFALEVIARRDLEQLAHFGFREFAREIEMTSVAIRTADVSWRGEVTEIGVVISGIGARGIREREAAHERACCYRRFRRRHATSLLQHRGTRASAGMGFLPVRQRVEMLSMSRSVRAGGSGNTMSSICVRGISFRAFTSRAALLAFVCLIAMLLLSWSFVALDSASEAREDARRCGHYKHRRDKC